MTQQQKDRLDRLVEDYLGAVSYACVDLPPDRRDDLVEDLREHIAAARAVLYEQTEAAVRTILDRLGEPAAIAEEARVAEGLPAPKPLPSPVPPGDISRPPTAVLGMVLGFIVIMVVVLVAAAILMRH